MKVGDWVSWCCEIDLHQIADQGEVDELEARVADDMEVEGWTSTQTWPTKEEALVALGAL